jgi:hypothetical protein
MGFYWINLNFSTTCSLMLAIPSGFSFLIFLGGHVCLFFKRKRKAKTG